MKAPMLLIAICCMGTSEAANDKNGSVGITVGERLVAARYKLIKQGWKPTRMHASDGYEYSGVERELAARNFLELDVCSFDSSHCILFYSKKGACLRVDTMGEQLKDMMVTRWTDECPDTPSEPNSGDAG
ncbi:hypothetical protein CT157_16315 [Pseudomonas syringae]|uniref:Uncharacterized protein n=1 Tax=Pseudomonas syringae TaxID=317 RepID=A0A3T0JVP5_PSESX|nr:hypothetical protein CT157_16315 [Pseudomonas syringae]